jgi:hypothetical protein
LTNAVVDQEALPSAAPAIIAKFIRMEKVGPFEFPYYETYRDGTLIGRGGPPSIVSIHDGRVDCTWEPIANSKDLRVKLTSPVTRGFRSASGDLYLIPEAQYDADVRAYRDAVSRGDEPAMLRFEECWTGWKRAQL